jgi:tetratricopeptide (TPR) repeat protein
MREAADVVSGPRKISMPTDKNEVEKELGEIRKEVIESRNLVIKTDNLLKNLHAELKLVGKRQEDFQKQRLLSSAVAYVLFAALCVAGAIMVSSASSASNSKERGRLEKQAADLTATFEKQKADAAAVLAAQRAASDVYRQMTTLPGDQRLQGIDALLKLDQTRLSPLERQSLADKAEQLRKEIGQAAFERGKNAFYRNDMNGAQSELARFIAMNPAEADLLDASYFLGVAYNQLRKHEQAVPLLARFVTGARRAKNRDYAMLLLAHSYEQSGQLDKAADTVRDALGTYPNSAFAPQLRGRLATVKRMMAGETAAPGAAAPAPGTTTAQATTPAAAAPAGATAPAAKPAQPPAAAPAGQPAAQ